MTALNPNKALRVAPASSERYPLNPISSKPGSLEPATDPHHIFPRGKIKSDTWFVSVFVNDGSHVKEDGTIEPPKIIPHVTGLSHEEHMDVEDHRAWIKYEDGIFNWYEMQPGDPLDGLAGEWQLLGPLNPQPAQVGTPKKKRRNYQGEQRRSRATISIKVPKDDREDGAFLFDELIDALREKFVADGDVSAEIGPELPVYNVLMLAGAKALQ